MRLVSWSVERADYIDTPGRLAGLRVGPFRFGVVTADGGGVAFGLVIWRWSWEWSLGEAEEWVE